MAYSRGKTLARTKCPSTRHGTPEECDVYSHPHLCTISLTQQTRPSYKSNSTIDQDVVSRTCYSTSNRKTMNIVDLVDLVDLVNIVDL